jgi:hypothetical protein
VASLPLVANFSSSSLDGIDLPVIDNLPTLTSGSEGASDPWLPMQNCCYGCGERESLFCWCIMQAER